MVRGFTLIEILIVITIIAVVSSVVGVAVVGNQAKARDATRKTDLKQIADALREYYVDHNFQYPGGEDEYTSDDGDNWIPGLSPYFKSVPKDPKQASLKNQLLALVDQFIDRGKSIE